MLFFDSFSLLIFEAETQGEEIVKQYCNKPFQKRNDQSLARTNMITVFMYE